jgi:hypothetical protein
MQRFYHGLLCFLNMTTTTSFSINFYRPCFQWNTLLRTFVVGSHTLFMTSPSLMTLLFMVVTPVRILTASVFTITSVTLPFHSLLPSLVLYNTPVLLGRRVMSGLYIRPASSSCLLRLIPPHSFVCHSLVSPSCSTSLLFGFWIAVARSSLYILHQSSLGYVDCATIAS